MFENVVLEGMLVRLEPLNDGHKQALINAIYDGELWKLHVTLVPHPDDINEFILMSNQQYLSGEGITFAVIEKRSGIVIGSTRFMKFSSPNKRVEIGYTFISKTKQKKGFNVEAKYLMLEHAFEKLELLRVEFSTDYLNFASRSALIGLGAKEEGVLRNNMLMPNGRIRDSVIYSVVRHEWQGIKKHLLHLLSGT